MRLFAVSGYSGTGKTTLVETLVSSLVERGYTVATIKSSKHEPGPERGSDTERHRGAGASATIFHRMNNESTSLTDRLDADEFHRFSKYDFLIIEGMKTVDIPRFWCIGDTDLNLDDVPVNTQAIVTWSDRSDLISDIPVLTSSNTEKLIEIVRTRALNLAEVD